MSFRKAEFGLARAATLGVMSLIVVGSARGNPVISLEPVDTQLSANNVAAWWSPIVHNAADGSTYVSYLRTQSNSNNDAVYVARRTPAGVWTTAPTGGQAFPDPGHTQSSIALDGSGRLHVFYGMHGGSIQYRRSNVANSVTGGFTQSQPAAFAGGDYTYPNLTSTPNGDVYLMIRDNPRGRMFRFNNATQVWSSVATFAQQSGTTVYPDQVFAGPDGDVHMIWEWAAGGAQASRHFGSYARYDPTTGNFYRADESAYPGVPLTTATADVYQPLEGAETFTNGVHGVQSAKMALDEAGRPVITYSYSTDGTANDYEHRIAHWDGSSWQRSTVERGPFDIDKSWIAYSDGLLRFYGTLSPGDPLYMGTDDIFLRTSTDFGQTWSSPVAITNGLSVQRPVGVTVDGVDYLYLPDTSRHTLYVASVVMPEPGLLGATVSAGVALACQVRRRRDRR